MYSQLILDAFEKVKSEEGITVKTNISKFLSDYIQENTNTVYGEKSLRNKHNKAVEGDSINLKLFVARSLHCLAILLQAFLSHNQPYL